MSRLFRPVLLWVAIALLAAGTPAPANAYVPVADHLLSLVAARLDSPPPSVVRQVRILPAQPPEPHSRQYRETVHLRFPGAFRSDLEADEGQRVVIEQAGLRWTIVDGVLIEQPPDLVDLALRLLVHTRPDGLAKTLAGEGVDVSVTSLGRFNDRIAFVLGARYPDESVPQLWVDNETLLPFRWLLIRPGEDGMPRRTEIRFLGWQKSGDLQYPQAMACYRDEQLISQVRVEAVTSPASVPDALFAIQRLVKPTIPAASSGEPAREPETPGQ
jgi:hypothetical protein